MNLDPVERVGLDCRLGIVVGHRRIAPPTFAALAISRKAKMAWRRALEGEIRWHAGREILRLMMDEAVDVAEADFLQRDEQGQRKRQQPVGWHIEARTSIGMFPGLLSCEFLIRSAFAVDACTRRSRLLGGNHSGHG
jgi:hypothetical protein